MIASRFRSVGWVGCVAAAALGCYLVSQRVASERAAVERLDRRILMAKIDIRKMETELGTRSRMPVLEQWNSNVLALSAPAARQYLHGEIQLARFEVPAAAPAPIQQVSASADTAVTVTVRPIPVSVPSDTGQPMLRHATYIKPAGDTGAMLSRQVALLDDSLLGELRQAAQHEKRGGNGPQ